MFKKFTYRFFPFLEPRFASRSCFLSSSILICSEAIIQALSASDRDIYSDGKRRILWTHQCMILASPSPSSISFLLLQPYPPNRLHNRWLLVPQLMHLQFLRLSASYQVVHLHPLLYKNLVTLYRLDLEIQ